MGPRVDDGDGIIRGSNVDGGEMLISRVSMAAGNHRSPGTPDGDSHLPKAISDLPDAELVKSRDGVACRNLWRQLPDQDSGYCSRISSHEKTAQDILLAFFVNVLHDLFTVVLKKRNVGH
jgi:hypothetical protein